MQAHMRFLAKYIALYIVARNKSRSEIRKKPMLNPQLLASVAINACPAASRADFWTSVVAAQY